METGAQFEQRKKDHIRWALDPRTEAVELNHFDRIELRHEALPEIDFQDIRLQQSALSQEWTTPFFVSSMTAGHTDGEILNETLAKACELRGWPLGVGSQRRQLHDEAASREWVVLRKVAPRARLFGNIGLSQIIDRPVSDVQRLVDSIEAVGLFIHLNALQECLQKEGTPQFKGGLQAITRVARELSCPVIVKETGCGMGRSTLLRLAETGVAAIDVSGGGGTHWGRIEGLRAGPDEKQGRAAQTFANWGLSTVDSLVQAQELKLPCEIWASGGVRTGLDATKAICLGARMVGVARPMLEAALVGTEKVLAQMEQFEFELKIALFCTGSAHVAELEAAKEVWKWRKI